MTEPIIVLVVCAPASDCHSALAELDDHGFTTWQAPTGSDARKLVLTGRRAQLEPNVIVVNRHLPDVDGLVLCTLLRRITSAPLILCSSVSNSSERVLAYRVGVDAIVKVPTSIDELEALIAMLLQARASTSLADSARAQTLGYLTVGSLEIDEGGFDANVGEHHLKLTPTEYRLLVALARKAPSVVPRVLLGEEVWDTRRQGSRCLVDNQIARLRTKLSEAPPGTPSIVSIRGVGYRLDLAS